MKKGLIMEGGAMRGMFTCGVIDVMMEHEMEFDGAVGVSAGAAFGCNYKSKQIGRPIRYNKKYCKDKRFGSFQSWLKTGDVFDKQFCYYDIPDQLDVFDSKTFQENPMEFHVVCTDVLTGKPVYYQCKDGKNIDVEWMRASASLPMISKIVEIGERKLLDGGIADSIPLQYFEGLGYDRNVVILTRPLDYIKEKNQLLPLARVMLRKYPNMIRAMAERHVHYNETTKYIREKELAGDIFVIRPKESLNISSMTTDPEELERVYQLGRKEAEEKLEQLKQFLKKDEQIVS